MPTQDRSWFSLIAFCAIYAIAAALALAILFASASVAFAVAQPGTSGNAVPSRTFAGMITDSSCVAKHATDSNQAPAECVRACVRKGSKYTLVDGDKVHLLDGKTAELENLAGQRVRVSGTLHGDTIRVTSATTQ